jgi:Ca-activated chloride channel family protein
MKLKIFRKPGASVGLTFLLLFSSASAQNEKPPAAQDKLVKINVLVTDRSDRAMDDVRKEDLQVLEDGVPQTISEFARDDRPVTCGFLIDASGSVRRILNQLIDGSKAAAGGLQSGDEGFVVRFVGQDIFQLKQEMTDDRESIIDALDDIYVEGGLTAVNDAVEDGLRYLNEKTKDKGNSRRRVLVLVTDGEDRGSRNRDRNAILAKVRRTSVQIFVLGLTKFSGLQSSASKATAFLNGLAEQSGGRVLFPDSGDGLPAAARELARYLHTQYRIGYTSSKSGSMERNIQVKWAGANDQAKRKVITRPAVTSP